MRDTAATTRQAQRRCHLTVTGVVQGVGFRPFVYNLATGLGLRGWVLNHSGGVDIEIEGPETQIASFRAALVAQAPPLAHIEEVTAHWVPVEGETRFEIRHSQAQPEAYQLISPDVATCPDCLRELFDPQDRRYRYPFINCTNCGPRFTIIEDIPYDRPNTTMRAFTMCARCQAEYEDPTDRRFHAQPNACPECGPHVWLVEDEGDHEREAAMQRAAALLRAGKILAIKGLGGFHLACDATNREAVRTLRARKRRPHKPFAIMVATLDDVRGLCRVPPAAEALLTSPQCPIVLLQAHEDTPIAPEVAPNSHMLGVMVPYTPLHHVLLRDVGRPLVMTSGNLSEEPIAKDNHEALQRLRGLADAFLLHNREIYARYDDSVVQVIDLPSSTTAARPPVQPVRRARGYAPFPVALPFTAPQIFAVGPLLKNTFTLTRDRHAFVSQHIGDLETLETLEHYQAALKTYLHLFRLTPERVACDMHPDYMSTELAEAFAREHGLPAPTRIQHHQAHVAACLVDNGWAPDRGPVIGVALDGTGYGTDGHIWGGEWFVGDYRGMRRMAHLEYLPLPGGDAAIRHPWRTMVAYLHALGFDEALPLDELCPGDVMRLRIMVDRGLNTARTSSMGRLFDAVSALLGVCRETTYEAQAAIELEQRAMAVEDRDHVPYPFALDTAQTPYQVRLAPLFAALLDDLADGVPASRIATRFHATVAAMIVTTAAHLRRETGLDTVALSGGVFQNRLLLALTLPQLQEQGFRVLWHHQVPPNDGGVSLGQAALAAWAITR